MSGVPASGSGARCDHHPEWGMAKDRTPLLETLAAMPVFAGLAPDDLDDVARSIQERDVKAGKTLIKQGQWGHELLVVLAGDVEIRRDDQAVATQGPGSVLGETKRY